MAVLPALAGRKGQSQVAGHVPGQGCRAGTAGAADGVALHKAVEVPAVGRQPGQLDMYAVSQGRQGGSCAVVHDTAEGFVIGHLPAHGDGIGQAAGDRGQEAGPKHDALRCGVATGHAQAKGVMLQRAARPGPAGQGCHGSRVAGQVQELAALGHGQDGGEGAVGLL